MEPETRPAVFWGNPLKISLSSLVFNLVKSRKSPLLQSYKEDSVIEEEDIVNAIPKTLQDNIFDLTQFILTKKMDQARDLVRDLTLQGEDEIKLIAVMLGQFRTFTQVKILAESGQTESQIASSF